MTLYNLLFLFFIINQFLVQTWLAELIQYWHLPLCSFYYTTLHYGSGVEVGTNLHINVSGCRVVLKPFYKTSKIREMFPELMAYILGNNIVSIININVFVLL